MNIGFEVLTAVAMNSSIFRDMKRCSLVKVNWHPREAYRLQQSCLYHAGFLIGLLFYSEDGGDMNLQKIG
jgi:hypothetical protein